MTGIDLARRAACVLITGVMDDHLTLAEQIGMGVFEGLSGPERARAQRLATQCLRNMTRVDAMLKPHMRRAPPADVLTLLRLSVTELCMDGAPPHGVVNAAVALIHSGGRRLEPYAGLVNAVLRKVSMETARWDTLPAQQLPGWLRGRLMSAWGKAATMRMEAAHAAGAPLDLTMKDGVAVDGEILLTGSVRMPVGTQVTSLAGYDDGAWWVQDAGAAMAARILDAKAGERVLDLCAAPGGKTMQMAAAGADVTALDISTPRLARLHENLERCGLAATVVAADALHWTPDAPFDAILLDAPCSATGTIRRHPELPFVKQSSDIKGLAELQSAMLDRALTWLKPDGRLVYCTCSLLPEEGEAQIAAAQARHPDLRVVPISGHGIEPEWLTDDGMLRLRPDYWPERGGMDGFFVAVLTKH